MTTNHVKTIVDDFLTKLGDLEMPPLVIGNLKKLADSDHLMQQAELANAIQTEEANQESVDDKPEDS